MKLYTLIFAIFNTCLVYSQTVYVNQISSSPLSEVTADYQNGRLYFYRNHQFYKSNSAFYDLYAVAIDGEEYSKDNEEAVTDLNSKYNDGPVFFNMDDKEVYLTRNTYSKSQLKESKSIEVNTLEILVFTLNDDNSMTFKKKFDHNIEGASVGHMTYSDYTKRLYFSAAQGEGHKGGIDLYYVSLDGEN